jgi:hypothetical protein
MHSWLLRLLDAPAGQRTVGDVVRLMDRLPDPFGLPVYGVLAARAPWAADAFLMVPADAMPLRGTMDLFVTRRGMGPADREARILAAAPTRPALGGLTLRGLTMRVMPEAEAQRLPCVGQVPAELRASVAVYVFRLARRILRPDPLAVGDPHHRQEDLLRVLRGGADAGAAMALRERIRRGFRCSATTWVEVDGPEAVATRLEARFPDGRTIRCRHRAATDELRVQVAPDDDVSEVRLHGTPAAMIPGGFCLSAGPEGLAGVARNLLEIVLEGGRRYLIAPALLTSA